MRNHDWRSNQRHRVGLMIINSTDSIDQDNTFRASSHHRRVVSKTPSPNNCSGSLLVPSHSSRRFAMRRQQIGQNPRMTTRTQEKNLITHDSTHQLRSRTRRYELQVPKLERRNAPTRSLPSYVCRIKPISRGDPLRRDNRSASDRYVFNFGRLWNFAAVPQRCLNRSNCLTIRLNSAGTSDAAWSVSGGDRSSVKCFSIVFACRATAAIAI